MKSSCAIEKHTWGSLSKLVKAVFPKLGKIIDELNPNHNYPLYLVKYPYGSMILDKGIFQIPNNESRLVPISHSSISSKIKDHLSYSGTIPLGLVVSKGIESFVQSKHRVLPATFIGKGKLVSLWRVLEEGPSYFLGPFWSIASGVRSICMIPKITDSACHKALKIKYGLKLPVPQRLSDQWELFTHIANHPDFTQEWSSELVFFSKKWFEHKSDKIWSEFYRFLLNEVWQITSYRRNQFIFDFAFSIAQENKNLKPNPYLADTVRHLVAIAAGSAPAFSPGIDDTAAPISGLQKVYIEDYGLKKYAPVIMHLHHLSFKENRPVYYSFQIPTTTIFSPKSRKLSSAMAELHELKHIVETLSSEILKGNLGVEQTPLFDLAKNTRYEYYHSDKDKYGEILPINELAEFDNSFNKSVLVKGDYSFPDFGPFFRGCISISRIINGDK